MQMFANKRALLGGQSFPQILNGNISLKTNSQQSPDIPQNVMPFRNEWVQNFQAYLHKNYRKIR